MSGAAAGVEVRGAPHLRINRCSPPRLFPPLAHPQVRLYDYLFTSDEPGAANGGDWEAELNPASETVLKGRQGEGRRS